MATTLPPGAENITTPANYGVDGGRAAWPGPDGAGYQGTTCTYGWVDISATGTALVLGDDDASPAIPIGFSFLFYGAPYTELFIGSNGFVSFGAPSTTYTNQCPLPDAATPDNVIAVMWDDMNPSTNSDPVYHESFAAGACPWGGYGGSCFVVAYVGYSHYGGADDSAGTWEAILLDDGRITLQYLDVGLEAGSGSTTGIEGANAGADHGMSYACDTATSLTNDLCVEFEQAPFIALAPNPLAIGGCDGEPAIETFTLANQSGANGTFALTYSVTSANGTITGQDQIAVTDGTTGDFDVTITPDSGLAAGTELTGTLDANGNSLMALADINLTVTSPITGWGSLADTTQGTRFSGIAYHDGSVYQIGGETGWWIVTGSVNVYDTSGDSWSAGTAMGTPVYGIDAVAIGTNIYVPGGTDCTDDPHDGCTTGAFYDTLQILDTATGTWSTDAGDPMPAPRTAASAVAADGKLYVVGGYDDTGTVQSTLYIYDPAAASGSRWTTGAAMPTARAYAAAGVVGDNLYVAGGWGGGTTSLYTLEVYSISGDTWMAGSSMNVVMGDPDPYAGVAPFGDGVLNDQYFMVYGMAEASFDGLNMTYSCNQFLQAYDTVAGGWIDLAGLPRCLYGTQGDGPNDTLYVISGRTNEGGWHMAAENQFTAACGDSSSVIFADGFESGDVSAWTRSNP